MKFFKNDFMETELKINIEFSDPIISRVDAWFTEFLKHGMSEEEAWKIAINAPSISKGPIMDALVKKIKDGYTFSNFIH